MDGTGTVLAPPSEPWRDESRDAKERFATPTRSSTPSTSVQADGTDNQYAVMVSTKQVLCVNGSSWSGFFQDSLSLEGFWRDRFEASLQFGRVLRGVFWDSFSIEWFWRDLFGNSFTFKGVLRDRLGIFHF